MEDFASILVRDYGLKPQGKSAPMSSTKVSPVVGNSRGSGYGGERKSLSGRMSGNASTFGQEEVPYLRKNGSSKSSGRSPYSGGGEDIFSAGNYDDVFGGPPKSSSSGPRYDDVFGEAPSSGRAPGFDDLFSGLGVNESKGKQSSPSLLSPRSPRRHDRSHFAGSETSGFDELLPGFSAEPSKPRSSGESKTSYEADPFVPLDPPSTVSSKPSSSAPFIDPMDVFTAPHVPPIKTSDGSRVSRNATGAFDAFDIFDGFSGQSSVDASVPPESSRSGDGLRKPVEDLNSSSSAGIREQSPTEEVEQTDNDYSNNSEAYISAKSSPFFSFKSDDGLEPAGSDFSSKPVDETQGGLFSSPMDSPVPYRSKSRSYVEAKEKWLTVNDVKLMTKPSSGVPPSRPPPLPGSGRYASSSRPKVDHMDSMAGDERFVSSSWPSTNSASAAYGNSSEEEQTGSATAGRPRNDFFGRTDLKANMADHAEEDKKDVEEELAAAKSREKERKEKEDARILREKEMKEAEAREEKEKERHRRYKEKEREREKDRAAVQRVTLEARERAAQEARERAQRSAVERATAEARERAAAQARARSERERAAVERANAEARERAEQRAASEKAAAERAEQRAAVERASAEARERAERAAVERVASEARERAERAAADRAASEARERAERAAVERAASEARVRAERAAAEKAAAARSRKSENDLESFFGASTPPTAEQRHRPASMNSQNDLNEAQRRSSVPTSRPSTAASNDDWTSLFGGPPQTNDDFREMEGETPERRRARNGSHQRSTERAKKALEEIKQRDRDLQREQAEKDRAADQLDSEIKRWAAGKEGNLRALLSTLQYVLWPECGWQPVSLSDLITAAAVKKTYRKSTLFVHPDKVQQKGATIQQKYIAEKVFDLLKEAWNKFNSEELF